MGTSKDEIRQWLLQAKNDGATHVIIVCDKWDFQDFPVQVKPDQDVHEVEDKYRQDPDTHKVMEVYHLGMSIEDQLAEGRAFNYEIPGQEKPKCPFDLTPLLNVGALKMFEDGKINHICPKCKRIWLNVDTEEWHTRERRVRIMGELKEGAIYDDVIKPVE